MNKALAVLIAAGLLLTGCGVSSASLPSLLRSSQVATAPLPLSVATPLAPAQRAAGAGDVLALESTLERLYAQTIPSVVNISVVENAAGQPGGSAQALGSGFVWDKQGDLVTNNHVVAGAQRIQVTFQDGTILPAKLVGADPDSDLAVIKVDAPANLLQPVQLADSTQVKVGSLSVAIGNPFGLEGSMSVGFVSALGRTLPVDNGSSNGQNQTGGTYSIPDVIQTDAAINPGNSGGVLIDDQGRVIGVTSAIISPVRASAGVGFAIPSAIVQQVVPALIQSGHYDHPWLGISGTAMTPDLAQAMKLDAQQHGVLVVQVVSGGPADQAGLLGSTRTATINGQQVPVGGDVIAKVDGRALRGFDDLIAYLSRSTHVGQTITLTVLRDGREQTLQVTLGKRPTR